MAQNTAVYEKSMIAELNGSSPYKNNTKIYEYYCDYVYEDRYTQNILKNCPIWLGMKSCIVH